MIFLCIVRGVQRSLVTTLMRQFNMSSLEMPLSSQGKKGLYLLITILMANLLVQVIKTTIMNISLVIAAAEVENILKGHTTPSLA